MSVLIKGMEMPANCFMCYLSRLNGERLFCNVTGEEVLRYKIAPECPMTEATESTERKHGKWKRNYDGIFYWWECSECHHDAWYDEEDLTNFCPNCGSRMVTDDV